MLLDTFSKWEFFLEVFPGLFPSKTSVTAASLSERRRLLGQRSLPVASSVGPAVTGGAERLIMQVVIFSQFIFASKLHKLLVALCCSFVLIFASILRVFVVALVWFVLVVGVFVLFRGSFVCFFVFSLIVVQPP